MLCRRCKLVNYVIVSLSVILLGLSLWGVWVDPYRDYKEKHQLESATDLYKHLDASFGRNGVSELFFADLMKVLKVISTNDWPDGVDFMPIQENWILNLLKLSDPLIANYLMRDKATRLFGKVELPEYRRAFARGFGLCSQLSLGVADLLNKRYGVDARVAGLNGHVVVQVTDGGRDWVIDPSSRYFAVGDVLQSKLLPARFIDAIGEVDKNLVAVYLSEFDNYISSTVGWGEYSARSKNKQLVFFYIVIFSYYFKWLIPILGIIVSTYQLAKKQAD